MSGQTTAQEASQAAYAEWMHHVMPLSGESPCPACMTAESPNTGCGDGILLWGAYRLARIMARAK